MFAGVALCLVGFYIWVINYYPQFDLLSYLNLEKNWPLILILIGFYLIVVQYNYWDDDDTK